MQLMVVLINGVNIVPRLGTWDAVWIGNLFYYNLTRSWLQSLITLLHIYTAYNPYTPTFPFFLFGASGIHLETADP
jgi:hypothetical protein